MRTIAGFSVPRRKVNMLRCMESEQESSSPVILSIAERLPIFIVDGQTCQELLMKDKINTSSSAHVNSMISLNISHSDRSEESNLTIFYVSRGGGQNLGVPVGLSRIASKNLISLAHFNSVDEVVTHSQSKQSKSSSHWLRNVHEKLLSTSECSEYHTISAIERAFLEENFRITMGVCQESQQLFMKVVFNSISFEITRLTSVQVADTVCPRIGFKTGYLAIDEKRPVVHPVDVQEVMNSLKFSNQRIDLAGVWIQSDALLADEFMWTVFANYAADPRLRKCSMVENAIGFLFVWFQSENEENPNYFEVKIVGSTNRQPTKQQQDHSENSIIDRSSTQMITLKKCIQRIQVGPRACGEVHFDFKYSKLANVTTGTEHAAISSTTVNGEGNRINKNTPQVFLHQEATFQETLFTANAMNSQAEEDQGEILDLAELPTEHNESEYQINQSSSIVVQQKKIKQSRKDLSENEENTRDPRGLFGEVLADQNARIIALEAQIAQMKREFLLSVSSSQSKVTKEKQVGIPVTNEDSEERTVITTRIGTGKRGNSNQTGRTNVIESNSTAGATYYLTHRENNSQQQQSINSEFSSGIRKKSAVFSTAGNKNTARAKIDRNNSSGNRSSQDATVSKAQQITTATTACTMTAATEASGGKSLLTLRSGKSRFFENAAAFKNLHAKFSTLLDESHGNNSMSQYKLPAMNYRNINTSTTSSHSIDKLNSQTNNEFSYIKQKNCVISNLLRGEKGGVRTEASSEFNNIEKMRQCKLGNGFNVKGGSRSVEKMPSQSKNRLGNAVSVPKITSNLLDIEITAMSTKRKENPKRQKTQKIKERVSPFLRSKYDKRCDSLMSSSSSNNQSISFDVADSDSPKRKSRLLALEDTRTKLLFNDL